MKIKAKFEELYDRSDKEARIEKIRSRLRDFAE